MLDPRQALIEAELLLQRMARRTCWACKDRPAIVLVWDDQADHDSGPCQRCGLSPDLIIEVVYGQGPLLVGR
jgi:hypothetical protein